MHKPQKHCEQSLQKLLASELRPSSLHDKQLKSKIKSQPCLSVSLNFEFDAIVSELACIHCAGFFVDCLKLRFFN